MFNIQTINCMQYSEPVVIEISTYTEHLVQKHNDFLQLKWSYLVLNEEKRKQRNKKEKLTESLTIITRRSNDNVTLVSETSHKQNLCENHKAALNENLPTLRIAFAVQFSNSVWKTRAILLFMIKIIEMFELHASMLTDAIRLISSDNPSKIYHNYT